MSYTEFKAGDRVFIVGEFAPAKSGVVTEVKVWMLGPLEGEQSVRVKAGRDRTQYWFRPRELMKREGSLGSSGLID